MLKLSAAHDMLLPAALFITGVYNRGEHPVFAGGFGDVYQASYTGKRVALKRIRTFMSDGSKEQRSVRVCVLFLFFFPRIRGTRTHLGV
jgi:hypothetical protein